MSPDGIDGSLDVRCTREVAKWALHLYPFFWSIRTSSHVIMNYDLWVLLMGAFRTFGNRLFRKILIQF